MVDSQVLQSGRKTKIGSRNLTLSLSSRNREQNPCLNATNPRKTTFGLSHKDVLVCIGKIRKIRKKIRKIRKIQKSEA